MFTAKIWDKFRAKLLSHCKIKFKNSKYLNYALALPVVIVVIKHYTDIRF